jgi:hypothetical protein
MTAEEPVIEAANVGERTVTTVGARTWRVPDRPHASVGVRFDPVTLRAPEPGTTPKATW